MGSQVRDDLEQLATLREWVFTSPVPIIGPLVSRFREAWNSISAKWSIRALIAQQSEFNRQLLVRLSALEYSTIENDRAAVSRNRQLAEVRNTLMAVEEQLASLRSEHQEQFASLRSEHQEQFANLRFEHEERIARLERRTRQGENGLAVGDLSLPSSHTSPVDRHPSNGGFDYFLFELKFRGSIPHVKESLRHHLEHFVGCDDVVDLGCGRGEFLELLREQNIPARGVDINHEMIEACRARDLDVVQMDVFDYLAQMEDGCLGGIFSAHLVEHLSPTDLVRLINLCHQKLRVGAPLVIETPNPTCLLAMATHFILDPTHVRPVHPEILRFLLGASGFGQMEVVLSALTPEELRLRRVATSDNRDAGQIALVEVLNANIDRLNDFLYGYQNYAIVTRKAPPVSDEAQPQRQADELPAPGD